MQGAAYILENHVNNLKYFIQLKYYTVNCLQRACVCVCFQNLKNSQLHKPLESSGMHGNANENLLSLLSSKMAGIPTTLTNMLGKLGNADDDHRRLELSLQYKKLHW